jgi:sec-independent protein translocase protein TatA
MFNLGLPELLIIGAAALLVFGPRRLPELAKGLGKGIRDFKTALNGLDEEEKAKPSDKLSEGETPRAPQQPTVLAKTEPETSHP